MISVDIDSLDPINAEIVKFSSDKIYRKQRDKL